MTRDLYDRVSDPHQPAYIVAEIGINHNGSLQLAKQTVDAAIAANVDAVKFQNFKAEDFVADPTLTYSYQKAGETITETLVDMFRRVEIDTTFLTEIANYCAARGVDWHSTPTSTEGIRQLVDLDVAVLKNGSDYLGHLPLISEMAATGLPLVLSTGMATLEDIEDAVAAAVGAGNERLVILHCTSQYPTPAEEVGLRRMARIAAAFGFPVGFSDHTEGSMAACGAVALGARWIEKHFTLDRGLPGPDHGMSEDPETLRRYIADIRAMEQMLALDTFHLSTREMSARLAHRLSCAAATDLVAGQKLEDKDIRYARPGSGFPPKQKATLVGRTLQRAVARGALFSNDDFL